MGTPAELAHLTIESDPIQSILARMGFESGVLQGQVAVVTGGARGIGEQLCRGLAALGADVVIADKRELGARVAESIQRDGGRAEFLLAELSRTPEVERVIAHVMRTRGGVDILVNNAVQFEVEPFLEADPSRWDYILATNARAPALATRMVVPGMIERRRGTVVNLMGPEGLAFAASMSASKVALRSLMISLSSELGVDSGVSLFGFAPGLVATPLVADVFPKYTQRIGVKFEEYVRRFQHNPGYSGLMPPEHCASGLVHAIVNSGDHHGLITDPYVPLHEAGIIDLSVTDSRREDAQFEHPNAQRLRDYVQEVRQLNANIEEKIRRRTRELSEKQAATESLLEHERHISQRNQRVAAVGILAAGVAHEINNPLTYVIANLDCLREILERRAEPRDGEARELIADVQDGAERIRTIVRELKMFSRVDEQDQRAQVDVRDVLESALRLVGNEIHHRADLKKDYNEVPPVFADPSRLAQVFVNLLLNAAHAVPEGRADDDEIRISTRRDNQGRVVVEVHDTGEGIAPEHQARIFEPFFTTKSREQGTGLGLSVCQGIVVSMGGEIDFVSHPKTGTTFRVTLPTESKSNTRANPIRNLTSSSGRARILVIDDDPAVARALVRTLRGHEAVTRASGKSAIALLAQDDNFDVILCDIMMPDLSGLDVHDMVCSDKPELCERFVFVTGGAFTPRTQELVSERGVRCIEKPIDVAELRWIIADAVRRRRVSEASALH